ncbi:MAG: hypothetical protein CVV27_17310 [Candidatus Melainabacteria bacterium HGW-Melainabacteria-1]|nr:MAG: hypothetical protein CVV27_17310 [Candidatus Melainabacteria bacterium HGW-Melainabacteria-1]
MIPTFHFRNLVQGSNVPHADLRSPGQLLTGLQPPVAKPAGEDRLQLSAVSASLAGLIPAVLPFQAASASKASKPQTAPAGAVAASGSENRSFNGVPATIHWNQRDKPSSGAPRIPAGYEVIKGTLPKGLSQTATAILKQGNPLGTYTPFSLGGKEYVALNEYHTHYAGRPHEPPAKIYAITVFQKH